jgi:hypothetical protein
MFWIRRAWSGYRFLRRVEHIWEYLLKDLRAVLFRHSRRVLKRGILLFLLQVLRARRT